MTTRCVTRESTDEFVMKDPGVGRNLRTKSIEVEW